jgi:thiol:disulfide interchange protein DsbD
MIPVTLSIIGSRDENQSFLKGLGLSATYVAGLSLTYALLGLAAATFGSHIRAVLQGTFFQAAISLVFFLLALSMFDVFMIQAPASLRNKFGSMKKTGLFGIFFLGMVSGLMASPCVAAPLAGILAFIATTGSQILGFLMLLIFAWGMSVPLLLIGAFSGSLNSLPKAGDWMNRIKEFYGFLLLGAAIYFAKPLVSIFWAELATSALLAAFAAFLGLFKPLTENTSLGSRVSKAFAVVVISVACAYAISATTRLGCLTMPQMINSGSSISASNKLYWHTDLDKAKETARKENRPVFIDFRADWCTICRELETNFFPTPEITMLLEKMVPVKIDATDPDEQTTKILDDFQIPGLPTLILLDKNGEEIKELRMIGNITSKQLEKNLRQALD